MQGAKDTSVPYAPATLPVFNAGGGASDEGHRVGAVGFDDSPLLFACERNVLRFSDAFLLIVN
jgi:hypothetical protein